MPSKSAEKKERVIEAVRQGLEGDAAVEFIRNNGYAMSVAGIARHLRNLGGRGCIQDLLDAGKSNQEILKTCTPAPTPAMKAAKREPILQGELFTGKIRSFGKSPDKDSPLYNMTKLSIRIPSELYEAVRAAAQAQGVSQNQIVVDVLTQSLSRVPVPVQTEFEAHEAEQKAK